MGGFRSGLAALLSLLCTAVLIADTVILNEATEIVISPQLILLEDDKYKLDQPVEPTESQRTEPYSGYLESDKRTYSVTSK